VVAMPKFWPNREVEETLVKNNPNDEEQTEMPRDPNVRVLMCECCRVRMMHARTITGWRCAGCQVVKAEVAK
jgi:hypothetical protein